MTDLLDLQYPVGKPARPQTLLPEERASALEVLAAFPDQLASALAGLSDAHLDTPYRPDGWSIRQLVHHVADSHMNAYSRSRHALTADWPQIFAYDQAAWAELPDAKQMPVSVSVQLTQSVHRRWVATLKEVSATDWSTRGYVHPENGRQTLEQVLSLYGWHAKHHLAHIVNCRARHGW